MSFRKIIDALKRRHAAGVSRVKPAVTEEVVRQAVKNGAPGTMRAGVSGYARGFLTGQEAGPARVGDAVIDGLGSLGSRVTGSGLMKAGIGVGALGVGAGAIAAGGGVREWGRGSRESDSRFSRAKMREQKLLERKYQDRMKTTNLSARDELNRIIELGEPERRKDYVARLYSGLPIATANAAHPERRAEAQNAASKHVTVTSLKDMGIGGATGAALVGLPMALAMRNPARAGKSLLRVKRWLKPKKGASKYSLPKTRSALADKVDTLARLRVGGWGGVGSGAVLGATAGLYAGALEGSIRGNFDKKATDIYNEYQRPPAR